MLAKELGDFIADFMDRAPVSLTPSDEPVYVTSHGNKTAVGLARSLLEILEGYIVGADEFAEVSTEILTTLAVALCVSLYHAHGIMKDEPLLTNITRLGRAFVLREFEVDDELMFRTFGK
jgi:hypothetical protein